MEDEDFLSLGEQADAQAKEVDAAFAFAQLHLVFDSDPRAAALLKHWEKTYCNARVTVGSPIDAYAAAEALRGFVNILKGQIEIAKTGKLA